jgi:hypothetical protein
MFTGNEISHIGGFRLSIEGLIWDVGIERIEREEVADLDHGIWGGISNKFSEPEEPVLFHFRTVMCVTDYDNTIFFSLTCSRIGNYLYTGHVPMLDRRHGYIVGDIVLPWINP